MARPGISGLGVATMVGGFVVALSGVKNATVLETLRALIRGEPIPSASSKLTSFRDAAAKVTPQIQSYLGGSATGAAVAAAAQRYLGVRYVWAGEDPENGWDCSGFVTYVLHHDFGLNLPDNNHTVTTGFLVWSGAITVPAEQRQAGDLVVNVTHMGIAIDRDNMINAPGIGIPTRIQPILPGVFVTRRPIAYGAAPVTNGGKKGKS